MSTPDLVIVGAGPAGATAALAASARGWAVELLDAAASPGGQLHRIYYHLHGPPGFDGPGEALAGELAARLEAAGVRVRAGRAATALAFEAGGSPRVELADGPPVTAPHAIVATGLRPRRLGVPGEREFLGRGVSISATRDRERLAGRKVAIAGGGDAAYENALLLTEVGSEVWLIVRGAPRARDEFRRRVAANPRIHVEAGARVVAIEGEASLDRLRLADGAGERSLEVDALVIKVGNEPNTEWCRNAIDCDAGGFVRADAAGATSHPRVRAIGDVVRPAGFTIAHATASADAAIEAIAREREAGGAPSARPPRNG